jgi:hypothetical protein
MKVAAKSVQIILFEPILLILRMGVDGNPIEIPADFKTLWGFWMWHRNCNYIRYDYTLGFSQDRTGKAQEKNN